MKNLLKSVAIATTTFLFLTAGVWGFNTFIVSPTPPSSLLTGFLVFLGLAPALVAGYLGGRLAAERGLLVGFASSVVALLLIGLVFFPPIFEMDTTMHLLGVLVASLAGGVGELYAVRAKNA